MSTIASYPGTPALFLNANNVDGLNNELVAHGADVASWFAEGSGACAEFLPVGATEVAKQRANPFLKLGATEKAVSFDGVFDQLVSAGSASKLNFFHTTGIFDLLIVLRRRSGGNPRRIFGCSGGSAQKGIQVFQQDSGGIDGCVSVTLGNNAGLIVSFDSELLLPLGVPKLLLVRGDGTRVRVTTDFYAWQSKTFTGAVGTGNAFADYHIGSIDDAMVTPNLYEGDQMILAAYSSNLTLAQLVAFKTAAEAEQGVTL